MTRNVPAEWTESEWIEALTNLPIVSPDEKSYLGNRQFHNIEDLVSILINKPYIFVPERHCFYLVSRISKTEYTEEIFKTDAETWAKYESIEYLD
jgi:hypothetical protein